MDSAIDDTIIHTYCVEPSYIEQNWTFKYDSSEKFHQKNIYNWSEYINIKGQANILVDDTNLPPIMNLKDDNGNFIDTRFLIIKRCNYVKSKDRCPINKGTALELSTEIDPYGTYEDIGYCDTMCGTSKRSFVCKIYDCCIKNNREYYCAKCGREETSIFAFNLIEIIRQLIVQKCKIDSIQRDLPEDLKDSFSSHVDVTIYNPITQLPFSKKELQEFVEHFNNIIRKMLEILGKKKRTIKEIIYDTLDNYTNIIGWSSFIVSYFLLYFSPEEIAQNNEKDSLLVNMSISITLISNLISALYNVLTVNRKIEDRKYSNVTDRLELLRAFTYESSIWVNYINQKYTNLFSIFDKIVLGFNIYTNIDEDTIKEGRFSLKVNEQIVKMQLYIKSLLSLNNESIVTEKFVNNLEKICIEIEN